MKKYILFFSVLAVARQLDARPGKIGNNTFRLFHDEKALRRVALPLVLRAQYDRQQEETKKAIRKLLEESDPEILSVRRELFPPIDNFFS
jgi:hypothetical protein